MNAVQIFGTIACLFCGDPCQYSENGSYCTDCNVYAMQQDNGRWKVYVPRWHVPTEVR